MGLLQVGRILLKHLDQGWVEEYGGQGVIKYWGLGAAQLDQGLVLNLKIYLFSFFLVIGFTLYFI